MVTLNCLREDHTHIDQDQRFSVAGPFVARGKHLETMEDFANVLREKYQPLPGHKLVVQVLPGVRDWKTYFQEKIPFEFEGHALKDSHHVFRFCNQSALPRYAADHEMDDGVCVDKGIFPSADDHGSNVIMLAKSYMRDEILAQTPVLVLPHGQVQQTIDLDDVCVRKLRPTATKPLHEYRKTADRIDGPPWSLNRAAAFLRGMCDRWESGALPDIKELGQISFVSWHFWCFKQ